MIDDGEEANVFGRITELRRNLIYAVVEVSQRDLVWFGGVRGASNLPG